MIMMYGWIFQIQLLVMTNDEHHDDNYVYTDFDVVKLFENI